MKKILMLLTGGTISMQFEASGTAYVNPGNSDKLVKNQLPELGELADIDTITLFHEDSSNIGPKHWAILSKTIEEHYKKYDGFVILHGTDTMAYTASALSFSLKNLDKPVILTGSQVPLVNLRSDARRNVINAVEVSTLPLNEVAICFNDKLFRGNRSTKMSIGDFDAFRSPNYAPLAEIGLHIETRFTKERSKAPFYSEALFDDNISLINLFPGLRTAAILAMIKAQNPKGIVIEAFGSGNMPVTGDSSILPVLHYCKDQHITVLIVSQAVYDAVDLTKYENGKMAFEAGAISARDMTVEASITKLMYLFGVHKTMNLVNQQLMIPLAGEFTL